MHAVRITWGTGCMHWKSACEERDATESAASTSDLGSMEEERSRGEDRAVCGGPGERVMAMGRLRFSVAEVGKRCRYGPWNQEDD
jgi:hypothetical protein